MIWKIKRTKKFLIRDIVIAIVFGMTVISLFVLIAQTMFLNHSRTDLINPTFAQHYNQLNSLTSNVNNAAASVTSPTGTSFLGQFDVVLGSFYSVISLGFQSYQIIFGSMANIISDFTFLDATVVQILFTALISALLISILFIVISSVTRGRI